MILYIYMEFNSQIHIIWMNSWKTIIKKVVIYKIGDILWGLCYVFRVLTIASLHYFGYFCMIIMIKLYSFSSYIIYDINLIHKCLLQKNNI